MRRTILPLLLALGVSAHAEVKITGVVPTNRAGVAIVPQVGEPFYLTITTSVAKQAKPYRLTVESPAGILDSGPTSFGVNAPGAYWMRMGKIVPLFDGPMDITVACSASKKPFKLRIVPVSPSAAIARYAPQKLSGRYGTSVTFDGVVGSARAWVPLPQSSDAQTVEVTEAPALQAIAREDAQLIGIVKAEATERIDAEAAVRSVASSVRTNLNLLRTVPMSAVGASAWLAPEERIQSTHGEIVAFARIATKGMKASTPVADVALAIYSSVLKRSSYAKMNALPDALKALRLGKGECGDLSALFVAACRAAGVPARTVNGFALGNDGWHVWAEFEVPGLGWVPVDPAYAVSLRSRSAYPLYFGVVPEMRDRLALCNGFTHSLGADSTTFLQTPQVFADAGVGARTVKFWSVLNPELTAP